MNNKLNKGESLLKDKVLNHEFSYKEDRWVDFNTYQKSKRSINAKRKRRVWPFVFLFIGVGVGYLYMSNSQVSVTPLSNMKTIVENHDNEVYPEAKNFSQEENIKISSVDKIGDYNMSENIYQISEEKVHVKFNDTIDKLTTSNYYKSGQHSDRQLEDIFNANQSHIEEDLIENSTEFGGINDITAMEKARTNPNQKLIDVKDVQYSPLAPINGKSGVNKNLLDLNTLNNDLKSNRELITVVQLDPINFNLTENKEELMEYPFKKALNIKWGLNYFVEIGTVSQKYRQQSELEPNPFIGMNFYAGLEKRWNKHFGFASGIQANTSQLIDIHRYQTFYFQSASQFKYYEGQLSHKSHVNLGIPLQLIYYNQFGVHINGGVLCTTPILASFNATENTNMTKAEIDELFISQSPSDYISKLNVHLNFGAQVNIYKGFQLTLNYYKGLNDFANDDYWNDGGTASSYYTANLKYNF